MRTGVSNALLGLLLVACGTTDGEEAAIVGDGTTPPPSVGGAGTTPGTTSSSSGGGGASSSSSGGGASNGDAGGDAAIASGPISCASAAPSGASHALPLPTYAGTCPTLETAPATTKIGDREFIVYRPTTIAAGEKLPIVFLWHWLGGSAEKMGTTLEVQAAVDLHRFIGVVPSSKSDALFRWPFEATNTQERVDEETKFFDDMLACVGAALPVNADCVSTAGVSAGALWSAQLAVERSQRISSVVSLSGGTGGVVRPWKTVPHRMPVLVLWGGSEDHYPEKFPVIDFEDASHDLEGALGADGHFMAECIHNCGHAVPPFDPPPPGGLRFDMMWRFLLDHPYWLAPGQSPYASGTFPPSFPTWCAVGAGKATPRPAGSVCE